MKLANFYYPRSVLKLLVIGFVVVSLPLVVALINAAISVQRLANQSEAAVDQAVQAARSSRQLMEQVLSMERVVRQYLILGDAGLLDDYVKVRTNFKRTTSELSLLPLDEQQLRDLKHAVDEEEAFYEILIKAPAQSDERLALIEGYVELSALARGMAKGLYPVELRADGLMQALDRMGGQRGHLDTRLTELASQLAEGDSPVSTLETERQAALQERVHSEKALAAARSALEGIDNELRGYEQTRHQRDEQALAQREKIGQRKLDQQALAIKAEQLSGAVVEAGFVLADVVATLAEDADVAAWEKAVTDFDAKLRRLEPVNLAAIAEHAEAAQRKEYLDAQDADLTAALDQAEDRRLVLRQRAVAGVEQDELLAGVDQETRISNIQHVRIFVQCLENTIHRRRRSVQPVRIEYARTIE